MYKYKMKVSQREQIELDDQYFASRVSLIPEKFYVARDAPEDSDAWMRRKRYRKNTNESAPKQAVKEASKKASSKRAKYEQAASQDSDKSKSEGVESQGTTSAVDVGAGVVRRAPARNLEELSQRLQEKLASLRSQRGGEKKVKTSIKPQKRKRKKVDKTSSETAKVKPKFEDPQKLNSKLSKSMTQISYGRLQVEGEEKQEAKNTGKGQRNVLNVKRTLEKAEKNRQRIESLKKSSKSEDREEAKSAIWEQLEGAASGTIDPKKSNPKLLKKQIKRLEKAKLKKTAAWRERKAKEKESVNARLDKREANIAQNIQKKKENKLKRKGIVVESAEPKEKRKRRRPGFEGKHQGFLNGDDSSNKKKGGDDSFNKNNKKGGKAAGKNKTANGGTKSKVSSFSSKRKPTYKGKMK